MMFLGTPLSVAGLQKHHVLHGTARRRLADEDGLTVYLCRIHHTRLHDAGEFDRELEEIGQRAWEGRYGSREDFIKRYGKSYL